MKKIIGKKGSFLGIGEFFSGLAQTINTFFGLLPKPIKFLMFLVIIIFFGNMMQLSLGLFGIVCNSDNIAYKVPFPNNLGLINDLPTPEDAQKNATKIEEFGFTELYPLQTRCSIPIKHGVIQYSDGNLTYFNGGLTSGYGTFYLGRCSDCEDVKIYDTLSQTITQDMVNGNASLPNGEWHNVCLGDSYHKNNSFFYELIYKCNIYGCNPPEGRHYSQRLNMYVCDSNNLTTCQDVNIGDSWDEQILSAGGVALYPDLIAGDDYSSDNFIGVKCVDIRPKIALFNQIEIFDYKIWLLILLIIFIFLMFKLKSF